MEASSDTMLPSVHSTADAIFDLEELAVVVVEAVVVVSAVVVVVDVVVGAAVVVVGSGTGTRKRTHENSNTYACEKIFR